MKQIIFDQLNFAYKGGRRVFQDFSLNLTQETHQGKITVIMGASGAGKSTLIKLLLGIEKPQSGTIAINPTNHIISYVPQEPVLFEHLSVQDNARYFQFAGAHKHRFNKELYESLIKILGLQEVIKSGRSTTEISGGQKQRLSLLRALSIEPDFLLLDEPCNGLDAEVKRSFLNQLRLITERLRLCVLYITHHKMEAEVVGDDIVYIAKDAKTGVVQHATKAPVADFTHVPPILDAVSVFRFPDYKLLPIRVMEDGSFLPVRAEAADYFALVDDHCIQVGSPSPGFPFKLISQSPMFNVIRHEASDTEWFIRPSLLTLNEVGEEIEISFKELSNLYSLEGYLLKEQPILNQIHE